jgi:hypothetical protein
MSSSTTTNSSNKTNNTFGSNDIYSKIKPGMLVEIANAEWSSKDKATMSHTVAALIRDGAGQALMIVVEQGMFLKKQQFIVPASWVLAVQAALPVSADHSNSYTPQQLPDDASRLGRVMLDMAEIATLEDLVPITTITHSAMPVDNRSSIGEAA